MSDQPLIFNRQSYLLSALQKRSMTPISYSIRQNYPNLAKQRIVYSPNVALSGEICGKEQVFNISKTGITLDATIETKMTLATCTATADFDAGFHLFETQQWLFRGRVVCEFSDAYTVCRVDGLTNSALQIGLVHASRFQFANSVADTGNGVEATCYTPVWASWLTNQIQDGMDTSFVESHQLRVVFNQYARSGFMASTGAGLVSGNTTCRLWMTYVILDTDEWTKLRAINHKPNEAQQLLVENSITEIQTLTSGAGSTTTIDFKVNACVFETHVYIRNNAINGLAAQPIACNSAGFVDYYSVKVASRYLFQEIPYRLLALDKYKMGANNLTFAGLDPTGSSGLIPLSFRPVRPITFYWGLNSRRDGVSGALTVSSKNNVQLILKTNTDPSTTQDCYVTHCTWNTLSLAPDGSVELTTTV